MKPKILIDTERLKYPNSGIATVCKSIIKGLSNTEKFSVKFYGPESYFKKINTNQVVVWKWWHRFVPADISEFQLVHVMHQLSNYFHTLHHYQKKIVTVHDLNFLHDHSSPKKKKKSQRLVQKNIGNADAIAFISHFAKNDFEKNEHLFQFAKRPLKEVVYNGLIFPEQRIFVSERLNYLKQHPLILNIGVLFPKKNQKVLLPLLQDNSKILVLVASDVKPDYEAALMDLAKKLGVQDRVKIFKNITEEEKYFLLQNCEALCHPSLAEGFGIPPLEALYFGKPVFLSTLTSLPEIGGDCAYYFDDFSPEKMRSVYENGLYNFNSDYEANRLKYRTHAEKFSYIKMVESYEKLYLKVLK